MWRGGWVGMGLLLLVVDQQLFVEALPQSPWEEETMGARFGVRYELCSMRVGLRY